MSTTWCFRCCSPFLRRHHADRHGRLHGGPRSLRGRPGARRQGRRRDLATSPAELPGLVLHRAGGPRARSAIQSRWRSGSTERGDPETASNAEANLGDIFIAQGDSPRPGRPRRCPPCHRRPSRQRVAEVAIFDARLREPGRLWLARGDLDKARTFTDQCLEVATRTMSRKYLVRGWRLRGEIAFASRAWDESEAALRRALTIAERVGNPTQLWKTHATLGALHAAVRRPGASARAYRSAVDVVERMKASVDDPNLAETLASAPPIRELYQRSGPE